MAFRPDRTQPDFADLITSLNNSRNQISDNPLYQTVFILLQRLTTSRNNIIKQIEDVEEQVSSLLAASYLTVNDESILLINSRRLLAGANITFDDTAPHIRTISSTGGGGTVIGGNTTPIIMSEEQEVIYPIEFLGNFPIASGSGPTPPAASGYWTPLTDGNVDETDLIFANGEAIAVFVPV